MALEQHGQYQILERIAVGGMAEIYLGQATDGGFQRPVVIKKIHPRFSQEDSFVQMLINEAKITARLNHVNVVQILDLVCGNDGEHFIVMEYVQGKDLQALMDRAAKKGLPLPLDIILYLMSEVCAGLDYAHRLADEQGRPLGLIHRDISPSNVLVSATGEVKLTDFGVARFGRNVSQVGSLKGKLGYMAPEQARAEPLDHRSDIFSAGALLFELVLGRRVFTAKTDIAMLWEVRKAEIPLPSTLLPTIHTVLERIILRALAPDPSDRFFSAQELGDALRNFRHDACPTGAASSELAALLRQLFEPAELRARRHKASGPIKKLTTIVSTEDAVALPEHLGPDLAAPRHAPPLARGWPDFDDSAEVARVLTDFQSERSGIALVPIAENGSEAPTSLPQSALRQNAVADIVASAPGATSHEDDDLVAADFDEEAPTRDESRAAVLSFERPPELMPANAPVRNPTSPAGYSPEPGDRIPLIGPGDDPADHPYFADSEDSLPTRIATGSSYREDALAAGFLRDREHHVPLLSRDPSTDQLSTPPVRRPRSRVFGITLGALLALLGGILAFWLLR